MWKLISLNCPRWIDISLYLAQGWAVIYAMPELTRALTLPQLELLIGSGTAFTIGALCYACQYPSFWPKTFGPHECFHLGTLLGFAQIWILFGEL